MSWLSEYRERRTFRLLKLQLDALNERLRAVHAREIARHAQGLVKPPAFTLNTRPDEILRTQQRDTAARWTLECERFTNATRNSYDPSDEVYLTALNVLRFGHHLGQADWLDHLKEVTTNRKSAVYSLGYLKQASWVYGGELTPEERLALREGIRFLRRSLRGQWRAIRREQRDEREQVYLAAEERGEAITRPSDQD
jgi:hypothetical protein